MHSADLVPAGVEEAQGGASQTVAACGEWAGGGTCLAVEGGRGNYEQQQEPQQQRQQAKEEEQLSPEMQSHLPQLPTGPFLRVLELLPAQDQACSGRLLCRDAWRHMSGVHHRTAHLGQPLPPHAVPWFERYGPEGLKQLFFKEKLTRPMAAAAASGSEANLAAVWGVVRQGLHPELLQSEVYDFGNSVEAVLVREGHAHLLPWLLGSGYPVNAQHAFMAAAQYCDLAGLRSVWQLLQPQLESVHGLFGGALESAAGSCSTGGAIAKMEWLLQQHVGAAAAGAIRLHPMVVAAAAARGDLDVLRWMLQRGCDFNYYGGEVYGSGRVLPTAMRHAGLEVVEWLVTEAGCHLPGPAPPDREEEQDDAELRIYLWEAAAASGSVAKLQWLRNRGLLLLPSGTVDEAPQEAARHGKLGALRYLYEECGAELSKAVVDAALGSGNVPTAAWLLHQGGRDLFQGRVVAFEAAAAGSGSLDMVRWLVEEGIVGAADAELTACSLVELWPRETQQQRVSLLSAVQLVLTAGFGPSGNGSNISGDDVSGGGGSGAAVWYQKLLAVAARRGMLSLCTYLHSQLQQQPQLPGPPGHNAMFAAAGCGCEALVEWLLGHGCGLPKNTMGLFLAPAERGDLATLRCLRRMGVPWPQGLLAEAVQRGCPVPMLQWLVAEGVPVDVTAVETALRTAVALDNRTSVESWVKQLGRAADSVL